MIEETRSSWHSLNKTNSKFRCHKNCQTKSYPVDVRQWFTDKKKVAKTQVGKRDNEKNKNKTVFRHYELDFGGRPLPSPWLAVDCSILRTDR